MTSLPKSFHLVAGLVSLLLVSVSIAPGELSNLGVVGGNGEGCDCSFDTHSGYYCSKMGGGMCTTTKTICTSAAPISDVGTCRFNQGNGGCLGCDGAHDVCEGC